MGSENVAPRFTKHLRELNRITLIIFKAQVHTVIIFKGQAPLHMEYCWHFWAGAIQYQLQSDKVQCRMVRLFYNPTSTYSPWRH